MAHYQILTTQNVRLNYKLAPLSRRISAKIIDGLILLFYSIFVGTIIGLGKLSEAYMWLQLLLLYLPTFTYSFFCEWAFNGQTFGKMARDIRVIQQDGTPASIGSFLIRWLIGVVEIQMSGGAIAMTAILFTERAQRLGDVAAGTLVIWEQDEVDLSETIYRKTNDNYVVTFPEVAKLTDQEVGIVQEALNRYTHEDWERGTELLEKTKVKLIEKLNIETDLTVFPFLQRVISDYNYLTGKV